MDQEAAHTRGWQTFDVVCGVPFLLGIALQLLVPLSFARGSLRLALILAGAGLFILGMVLVVLARRELRRHRQPTDPGRPTSQIVTTGVFSFSRNPLYLGGLSVLAGLALAFNLPWSLALLLPAAIACHILLVIPEEKYLDDRFGTAYRQYAAAVHRWLGRARHN